jgi:hypothetical protein
MKFIAEFAVFVLAACAGIGIFYFWQSHKQSEATSIRIPDRYPGLNDRVENYYRLEQEKKRNETWDFRVPPYQQLVPKDAYVRQMTHDTTGWELKSYAVREISEDGRWVILKIKFVESPPKDYLPQSGTLAITESSTWERIDGIWQAWETGSRMHLSLNMALAAPNQSLQGTQASGAPLACLRS